MVKNLAAIATPFAADGRPDLDAFGAHLDWLYDAGLDGVFVAGTTGEGVLLEQDEVAALVERAVAADGSLRVIAQVGRPSTRATVALARRALDSGAHAVAAYVPWFYPVTQVQLRRHFLALLKAAGDAPAFMYNIPPRTVNDLDPALAGELAAAGFAGMKDSTGDFARHEAYLRAVDGRDFELYTGTEPLLLRSVRAGSTGTIGALLNCAPELFTGLRDALERGDEDTAARLQDEITTLKEQTKAEESTVVAVKRRVRERLAERGVDYPASPRAPFT
jgi:dihydrodipicolinate synthase/N-acetylneuraminate lyase